MVLFTVGWMAQVVGAPTQKFDVQFTIDEDSPSHVCFVDAITNLQDSNDDFPYKAILNESSIDLSKVTVTFEEWKSYEVEVDDYSVECNPYNTPNGTLIDNCARVISGSHIETRWRWIEKNLVDHTEDGSTLRNQWEEIQIKKSETKKLRRCYYFNEVAKLPNRGWGSYGSTYIEASGETYYDFTHSSWWNSSWGWKQNITITIQDEKGSYTNYFMNVSADLLGLISAGKMEENFKDLRIVTDSSVSLDYKVIQPADGSNASIYFNFTNSSATTTEYQMYYTNPTAEQPTDYNFTHWVTYGVDFDNMETGALPDDGLWGIRGGYTGGLVSTAWFTGGSPSGNKSLIIDDSGDRFGLTTPNNALITHGRFQWTFMSPVASVNLIVHPGFCFDTCMDIRIKWLSGNMYYTNGNAFGGGFTPNSNYTYIGDFDTDSDKYNLTIMNETDTWTFNNNAFQTAISGIKAIGITSYAAEDGYLDNVLLYGNVTTYLDPIYSFRAERDATPPASTMGIDITTPANTSYWGRTLYANFSANDSFNSSFVTRIFLDDALIYTNNSYANNTELSINLTDYLTDTRYYNITIYAESLITSVNSSVIFTIEGYEIINASSNVFVNETLSYDFETIIRYNKDFFNNVSSLLIWNDTAIGNQTTQLDNTTHIINTINYTIPLTAVNNTEIQFIFQNIMHLINGSVITTNGSSVDQNITYSVWINSITTDLSNYITGEEIEVELNVYNETTTATIIINTTIIYNSTYSLSATTTSFTMTGINLRTYETALYSSNVTVSPTLRNITGNITISYAGRTRTEGVQTAVNISTFNITNCTSGDPSITVRVYNEWDFAVKNGSIQLIYFDVSVGNMNNIFSYANTTEGTEFIYCIEPSWATVRGDIYIEYKSGDSPERHYYATNISITDTENYIDVYLLNSTYAYYTNIYLYDENNNKKTNTLVRILKMNPETSIYTTMFIDKTDSDGILDIYLEPITQPYMFYVFDNGEILYATEPETIPCVSGTCPPYEKSIYINTTLTGYINFGGYSYSIDWDNSTRELTVDVADTSGLSESIKLDIFSIDSFGKKSLYYTSTTNSSTIYYSEILPDNIEEYLVSVETMQYDQWYPLAKQTLTITELMALGVLGILLAIILTATISMAGIYTFEGLGGLIGVGAGLGVSKVLRLIPLGWVEYAGIWVVLIIIGFAYIRNR